jgi:predicted HD superfamily hydrolase involved in NAD metabolism
MKIDLEQKLTQKRYLHSLRVCETALKIARIHNGNEKNTIIASLLHDYAKCMDKNLYAEILASENLSMDPVMIENPGLAHGYVSAILVSRRYGISDNNILNAIRYHTCGRPAMTQLEKIIYLADYIEPARDFPGIESIRKVVYKNLDQGMMLALDTSIAYVKQMNQKVHSDSIRALEYYRNEVSL